MTASTTCGGAAANDVLKRVVGALIVALSGLSFVDGLGKMSVSHHPSIHLGTR